MDNSKLKKPVISTSGIDCTTRSIKAVANPLRLKILYLLGRREVCVHDITNSLGTSRSNISQHLSILRSEGVLLSRKSAGQVLYRIGDVRTLQIISMMKDVYK